MDKLILCKTCQKEMAKSAKFCPHCGAKNKKSKLMLIAVITAILAVLIIAAIALNSVYDDSTNNTNSAELINVVKTGYLGNYKSASIGKVFNKMFSKCTWTAFESNGKNIVEISALDSTNTPLKVQFSVEKNNTFKVVFIKSNDRSPKDAYSAKTILDVIYDEYSKEFDSSIVCDSSTNNDTLSGTPNDKYKK